MVGSLLACSGIMSHAADTPIYRHKKNFSLSILTTFNFKWYVNFLDCFFLSAASQV